MPPDEPLSRFADADKALSEPRPAPKTNFGTALREAETKFDQRARQKIYYRNPAVWAWEVLGFEAWSKQREIGQSVVDNAYTAVKSCHGAGKSAWAAVLVCWFVATRLAAGEEVFVITTAPSYSQVHLVLWEEIRKLHARGKLPGYITNGDEWKIEVKGRSPIELAKGRKPSDTDANSFQGKHAYNLFIVLDEANGIPGLLYTSATVMLTGDMNRQRMLAIGNPDDPNSQFGLNDLGDRKRILAGKEPLWNTIQIKAWDTPNFTDEGKTLGKKVLGSVLSRSWVEKRREEWGEEDPRWISKIEADFPDVSEHSLFSLALIDQATHELPDPGYEMTSRIMGVDVARFGRDRSVVALNVGGQVSILDHWSKKNTIETANRVHMLALEHKVTEIRVDEVGVGGGVFDFLVAHQGYNYRVIRMVGNAASPNIIRWRNARDFWFDDLREQMYQNRVQIPNQKELHAELAAIQYDFVKGAMKVEEKSEIKKRLKGASTDFADAVAYATARVSSLIGGDDETPDQKHQAGDTAVLDFASRFRLEQMARGYSVSPV